MSEISDWIQSNWFELGSFLVQCAILATLTWYGRKTLRVLMASHDRDEALQRLSLSNATAARRTTQQAVAPTGSEGAGRGLDGVATAWRNLIGWLQAPMGSGAVAPWQRVIRWLQAPLGN
jgi:hypothetical protein